MHWGHLKPNEFRYVFWTVDELRAAHESSESESDDDADEKAKAELFALTNRSIKDKAVALGKQGALSLGQKAMQLGRAMVNKSTELVPEAEEEEEEEDEPGTPEWARRCGFTLATTGVVPEEGLIGPLLERRWDDTIVALILSFLNPRGVGRATLNRAWTRLGYADGLYADLVRLGDSLTIEASGRIDAVCYHAGSVLASGDRRVLAFEGATGEFSSATRVRDTTDIVLVVLACGSLWTASANGAIREWSAPHDVANIEFKAQLWEHSKRVNDLCDASDADRIGNVKQLQPILFSCADDRSVKLWNTVTKECEATLRPFNRACATMRALCVSDAHIFVGSSDGIIYVYGVDGKTRRQRHRTRIGLEALFPLEIELDNGDAVISRMRSAPASFDGVRGRHVELYVASYDGALRVWNIPKAGLDDFQLKHAVRHHADRITCLVVAQRHVITASDDQTIRFYGRYHDTYEDATERVLSLPSRVKALVTSPLSSFTDTGTLVCGMSNGALSLHAFGPRL